MPYHRRQCSWQGPLCNTSAASVRRKVRYAIPLPLLFVAKSFMQYHILRNQNRVRLTCRPKTAALCPALLPVVSIVVASSSASVHRIGSLLASPPCRLRGCCQANVSPRLFSGRVCISRWRRSAAARGMCTVSPSSFNFFSIAGDFLQHSVHTSSVPLPGSL